MLRNQKGILVWALPFYGFVLCRGSTKKCFIQLVEVCVPELGTKRDKTGRDWRRDYFFMVPLLGKNSGRDGTTRYQSGKVLDGLEMNYITYFSTQQEISRPVPGGSKYTFCFIHAIVP